MLTNSEKQTKIILIIYFDAPRLLISLLSNKLLNVIFMARSVTCIISDGDEAM